MRCSSTRKVSAGAELLPLIYWEKGECQIISLSHYFCYPLHLSHPTSIHLDLCSGSSECALASYSTSIASSKWPRCPLYRRTDSPMMKNRLYKINWPVGWRKGNNQNYGKNMSNKSIKKILFSLFLIFTVVGLMYFSNSSFLSLILHFSGLSNARNCKTFSTFPFSYSPFMPKIESKAC